MLEIPARVPKRPLARCDAEIPARVPKRPLARCKATDLSCLEGSSGHFIESIKPFGGVHQKAKPLKKCVVCTAKGVRKETRYCCKTCSSKSALCIVPCFKLFHTVRNLSHD